MKRMAAALALALLTLSCRQPPAIELSDAWTRDTIGSTAAAAVYLTIASPTPDRLLAASTPLAGRTDLMTMTGGRDAMAMDYVDAIAIPAGQPVSLNPAGLHVWLADLDRPLKAGETFALALEFERAGTREVTVNVIAPAAAAPGMGMER